MKTVTEYEIPNQMVGRYFKHLVNQFFKILPMKESGEPSLDGYLKSLRRELLGNEGLMIALKYDARYLSLLAILQYFIDERPDVATTKADVFRAISLCKKMGRSYRNGEG